MFLSNSCSWNICFEKKPKGSVVVALKYPKYEFTSDIEKMLIQDFVMRFLKKKYFRR